MPLVVHSPYENLQGAWLRGNLHAHTTESDGEKTPEELVAIYDRLGYDFLALSDHDLLTPAPSNFPDRMVFLQGNEITARGPHLLHIGATSKVEPNPDRAVAVQEVMAAEGLCILNHPNWGLDFIHWDQRTLETLPDYHGIEVYNGVVRRLEGTSFAMDRWDRLLTRGRRIWGYGNDDAHIERDIQNAWNWVNCEKREAGSIVASLKTGRFYASIGVELSSLSTEGTRIRIVSKNGSLLRVSMDWGIEVECYPGRSWELDLEPLLLGLQPSYVRFEVLGDAGTMAWIQPLFLTWT